ncbi:MAG: hypothetical protein R3B13_33395 [Polyangiaceae bacterium]
MEPVRNQSSIHQNQSHYDDEQRSSQATQTPRPATPSGDRGALMSCPPPASSLRSEAPAPRTKHDDAAGYTGADGSTQVSRDAVSELVKRASKPTVLPPRTKAEQPKAESKTQDEPGAQEKTLCEKRKNMNAFLCGLLGSVAAGRVVPGSTRIDRAANATTSSTIGSACERTFNWLEENAPGGACGK